MADLKGRSALITGGGRGTGAAIARALADAGAAIVVAARSGDQVEAVSRELAARGARASAARVDVTDPASVDALIDGATRTLGRIDWFLLRGLRPVCPAVIPALDGAGRIIADHDAIAVTLEAGD